MSENEAPNRLALFESALRTIADEPCLWIAEKFNHGKTCREGTPVAARIESGHEDPGAVFATESWCSVCIATAALEAAEKK